MPGMDGLALLKQIKQRHPMLPVIIMTAHSDLDAAVSAYQQGAFDYLPKPFDIDEAVALVERAISHYQEQQQPARSQPANDPAADIIGEAPAMQEVFRAIGRLSHSNITVLINGESGTGKELVARAIHQLSDRKDSEMISVNCAAIPENLIESELFGHEKGAFTGATANRTGLVEAANGSTLFLDEIGELPLDAQARLLRVLQESEIRKVGSVQSRKVDVRLVVATHRDLKQLVIDGEFREDLYYRINVMALLLPPLKERGNDILELADAILARTCRRLKSPLLFFTNDATQAISTYPWPGNVRELQHAVERAVIMSRDNILQPEDFFFNNNQPSQSKDDLNLEQFNLEDVERILIRKVLSKHNGNITYAAQELGLTRSSLYRRLEKYGL
jgi:two-component system nitrogen regulation response regulator GlnG